MKKILTIVEPALYCNNIESILTLSRKYKNDIDIWVITNLCDAHSIRMLEKKRINSSNLYYAQNKQDKIQFCKETSCYHIDDDINDVEIIKYEAKIPVKLIFDRRIITDYRIFLEKRLKKIL